ncbi:MAG: hypothetical protein M3R35_07385 [Candidatus Eremiobacteraeota bacterium]|nr:hypothetical protein [Candidatus Eremiobacteraeota bacterium]
MTTTDHLTFSVLSAPLAAIDRRGLSQAWYSALYACESGERSEAAVPARATVTPKPALQNAAAQPVEREPENASPKCAGTHDAPQRIPEGERRSVRSPLAKKIERAVARKRHVASGATLALDGPKGRVQLLVRTSGTCVRLIALCPESAREQVGTALAQARYALASRGIALTASTRGASC